MKAIALNNYGSPEDLIYTDIATPTPAPDQVLVKIHAAAVNFLDVGKAMGAFKNQFEIKFPWIPGIDFSGVIESAGADVHDFKAGDEVYGESLPGGTFAEFIAISPKLIALKPETLSFTEAASVPVSAETAWQILFQPDKSINGKTILIHGGAGAVGAYTVQLAHQAGAKVLVTATADDFDTLKSLGADKVIDRNATPFESVVGKVDIVIDLVGKDVQQRSYQVVKEGGYLITSNQPPSAEMAATFKINASFIQLKPSGSGLSKIAELIDSGKLKIGLSSVYSLQEAAKAWNELLGKTGSQEKKKNGRVVLNVVAD